MIWGLYPTYVQLTSGEHARLLIVFDLQARQLIGLCDANDPHVAADLLRGIAEQGGPPSHVVQLPNRVFDDLYDVITPVLARARLSLDTASEAELDEHLEWLLNAGRDLCRAAERDQPRTAADACLAVQEHREEPLCRAPGPQCA